MSTVGQREKKTQQRVVKLFCETLVTVWLVDWKQPEQNDFAIAEEVTVPAADAKAHGKRPDDYFPGED